MINCPKCQVPNPDSATICAACGSALVGQQFAQALDQAMAAPPPAAAPAADPAAALMAAPAPAPDFAPMLQPSVDPAMAQAEISRFMSEQRSRRMVRYLVYGAIVLVLAGIATFFILSSSRKKALKEEVARFYQEFNRTDDDLVGVFFKCVVRAAHIDIHKAGDTLQLTDGLDQAFNNFPKSQPGYIRDKCIPRLSAALEDYDKMKPPSGFAEPLDAFKSALKEVRSTFERYAAVIEKRKNEAADEQEIRDMNGDFHKLVDEKDPPKALDYFNLLKCAVPDLAKMAKGITKPPDTQPVVEYIYNTCKANPKYADKLRRECFAVRKDNKKKTKEFHLLANRMAGDPRDLEAINDCFRRANRGFAQEEIEAVAKVFVKYAEARGKVRSEMAKVKTELSD